MCVSFWLLDKHPSFWLALAANRDEYLSRPSLRLRLWEGEEDETQIVAGRDELGGGTWLGITKTGRLAFLTNVREAKFYANRCEQRKDMISRGALPTRFLRSHKSPVDYLEEVALQAHLYHGFNLVVADFGLREMAFLSNRPEGSAPKVHKLSPGLHTLSNGSLNSNWPKMERGKKKLEAVLKEIDGELPHELIVEHVLQDRTKADDVSTQAAETGCTVDVEQRLSSIFVDCLLFDKPYGTRSMSVIGIRRDGRVSFFERSLEQCLWKDHLLQFPVEQHQ